MDRHAVTLVLVVCLVASGAAGVAAITDYDIATDQNVPVPERTVTYNSDSYPVDAIARVEPNGTIDIRTDIPDNTLQTVYLYNDEEQIERSERGYGDLSFSFATRGLSAGPGTYMLVLEADGTYQAVHPVVVAMYRAELSAPNQVGEGQSIEVSGSISRLVENASEPTVKVVIGNQSTRVTETATLDSSPPNASFSATVTTATLSPGTYSIYATVQGPEKVSGNQELIGLSDAHQIEIGTDTESGGGSNASGSADTTTTPGTDETSTTTDPTATPTTDPTATTTDATTDSTTNGSESSTEPTRSTATTGGDDLDGNPTTTETVITPNESTSPTGTTETQVPLFRPETIVGLLAAIALLGYRRGS